MERHAEDDVAVHLEESPIRVVGESRRAAYAGQPDHGLIVEPEIEDRFHHPRHRYRSAGPDRHEQRVARIAEPFPRRLLQSEERALDRRAQRGGGRSGSQEVDASAAGDRKPRGDGHPEVGHLGEIRALATEHITHGPRAVGPSVSEKIDDRRVRRHRLLDRGR